MSWMTGVRARLRQLWSRAAAEQRMNEEMRFHLEMEAEQNLRRGLDPVEARRRAVLAFGGVEKHREVMRDGRRLPLLEDLVRDIRHAARSLARVPGFALVAVIMIGLGVGLTATMFSIVYGVLFRGLPFAGSDRIVHVSHAHAERGEHQRGITIFDYLEYARGQRSFEALGAFLGSEVAVSGREGAEWIAGARVSNNTFEILGVRPVLGRGFTAAEEGGRGEPVAIIGHGMWRSRFGEDAQILGRTVRVNGQTTTIVGVMPPRFSFPERQQIWLPLGVDAAATPRGEGPELAVFGRLRAGTGRAAAAVELNRLAERIDLDNPATTQGWRPVVIRFIDYILGDGPRALLLTMLGAVFFVMLIACTNVANLLISRAVVRTREVGVRSALGASRGRIVRQFMNEAMLLCVVGSALGVMLAYGGSTAFQGAFAPRVPPWMEVKLDLAAMFCILVLTVLTALFAGVVPALQAARADARVVLGDESRGASSFRIGKISRALVVFEITLACGLLVAAGLTTKSIVGLRNVDLGFDADNLLTASFFLPAQAYADSALPLFLDRVVAQVGEVPAFTEVALASSLPGLGGPSARFAVEGATYAREQDRPSAMRVVATPSYLRTLGAQTVEGRDFSEQDRAGSEPVILVNRGFARKFFPGGSVLGRRIRLDDGENAQPWRTIVGVVPDLRFGELAGDNESETVLIPLAQHPGQRLVSIIGRTRVAPLAASAELRSAVARVDADLPLLSIGAGGGDGAPETLRQVIARDTWFFGLFGGVFIVFGAAALVLATIGVYGVLAFSVSQREREIGIRMAIGATARQVRSMIVRQGLTQVAIGMVAGLAFAAVLSRLLSVILFDVQARDPLIFGGVVFTLVAAALLACILPAWRATSVLSIRTLQT